MRAFVLQGLKVRNITQIRFECKDFWSNEQSILCKSEQVRWIQFLWLTGQLLWLKYRKCTVRQVTVYNRPTYEWMNEWMMHLYSAFCVLLYAQSAYNHVGGSLLNHHQCAASTWMMRRLPQDNGASALTTHQLQVERRESHRANKVDSIKASIKWSNRRMILY